jgi:hypothetical protein
VDAKLKSTLTDIFKHEIHDRAMEIDPEQSHDWRSLVYGWTLSKGLSPKDASEFANYIRYETHLG